MQKQDYKFEKYSALFLKKFVYFINKNESIYFDLATEIITCPITKIKKS